MRINAALKLDRKKDGEVLTLAERMIDGLNQTSTIYINPNPGILTLTTHANDFRNAMAKWGQKGNRGSKQDLITKNHARAVLCKSLTQLAKYALSVTPNDAVSLTKLGVPLKAAGKPIGKLSSVRDLREMNKSNLSIGSLKIGWKRPSGTSRGNVRMYGVFRSITPSFADAKQIEITSKCTFIDKNLPFGIYYYWVIPLNSEGNGVESDMCIASPVRALY